MRYQGGKARTARRIAQSLGTTGGGIYIEPFLGGGSVATAVAETCSFSRMMVADAQPDLVALWRAGLNGWIPPVSLSREEYSDLRGSKEHSALRGWAAFACSHSGKYFGGYGASAPGRDYLSEASRGFLRKANTLQAAGVSIHHLSYDEWRPREGDTVYADPPYAQTEAYAGLPAFDSDRFWVVMSDWAKNGVSVYVSEYSAPPEWLPLWSVSRSATLDPKSSKTMTESLFVFAGAKND